MPCVRDVFCIDLEKNYTVVLNYAEMAFHPCLEFYESTIDEELQEGELFVSFLGLPLHSA